MTVHYFDLLVRRGTKLCVHVFSFYFRGYTRSPYSIMYPVNNGGLNFCCKRVMFLSYVESRLP